MGALAGCGRGGPHITAREYALERAQFVQIAAGLRAARGAVAAEVSAARTAWPSLAGGLPDTIVPALSIAVARASLRAAAVPTPRFMVAEARRITGPSAGIASLYEAYVQLAARGWRLTQSTIAQVTHGAPAVAAFARENSSLYIDAIYDAHFDLSLIDKDLLSGYEETGGPSVYGARLTQAQIASLAAAYSIPAVRLEPHPARAVGEV